jgi:hypothetical protein
MPKSNFEIRNFNAGIVAKPEDERDIPQEAASYSLNIDPQAEGNLQGIPSDKILKDTGFEVSVKLTSYTQGGLTQQSQGPEFPQGPPPAE